MKANSEIPVEDKVVLSPIDKYRIYGRFPYHLVIHILVLVFNTLQATLILSEFSDYYRAQELSFFQFLISDDNKEKQDFAKQKYLYTIDDLQDQINNSIIFMLNANATFFNEIIYVDDKYEGIERNNFDMNVEYKMNITEINTNEYKMPIKLHYQISEEDFGPFNDTYEDEDIKNYLNVLKKFEIVYNFKIYVSQYYKEYEECFIWKVKQIYDFSKNAHFVVSLDIEHEQCIERTPFRRSFVMMISHLWIHFIVIILATISALFCLYNFHEVIRLRKYRKEMLKRQKNKRIKNALILKESETISKASNIWDVMIIFSNLFQIIGSLVSLLNKGDMNFSVDIYIAFGVLLSYSSIGKYMSFNVNYALFYKTLKNSWSNFIPALLSTLLVFLAFIFLGLCLFWNSERFTNVSDIMRALFALFIGDSIHDIVSDLTNIDNFLGQLYGYIYTILFIVVVMNVFVAIIQSAFIKAKFESKSNWIYNSLMKVNEEISNENLRNLPVVDNMSPKEIKEDMEKRMILMNQGFNKCMNIIIDVENKNYDEETKNEFRGIIYQKVEEIDIKFEFIKMVWAEK